MAAGKYREWLDKDKLTLLEGWARDGLTDEQIARNIGISVKTLYDWKNKYGNICNALKKGKEVADYTVENALFKRAIGYEYEETQQFVEHKGDTINKKVVKTMKHIPPETAAAIFWLKNRTPEKWKDNPLASENSKGSGTADDWVNSLVDGETADG